MENVVDFLSIQGNIGAGKSYVFGAIKKYIATHGLCVLTAPLEYANHDGKGRDLFLVVDEPVGEWCEEKHSLLNCDGEGDDAQMYSYLGLFYKGMDMEKYGKINPFAFDFQVNTFSSRAENLDTQLAKIRAFSPESGTRVHVISERSLRTDRLFFKNVYESGNVPQHQWHNYERIYRVVCAEKLKREDAMLYVKTSPEMCYHRIHHKRKREGESTIPLEYLESLDVQHDHMIKEFKSSNGEESVTTLHLERDISPSEIETIAASLMRCKHAQSLSA